VEKSVFFQTRPPSWSLRARASNPRAASPLAAGDGLEAPLWLRLPKPPRAAPRARRNLRVQRTYSYHEHRRPKRERRPRQACCLHGGRDDLEGEPLQGVSVACNDCAACWACCAEQAKSKCSPETPNTRGMQLLLLERGWMWCAAVRTVPGCPVGGYEGKNVLHFF